MSVEVQGVSEVARELAEIKKLAADVAQDLRQNMNDAKEALELTQAVSKALRDASAELRGILAPASNNPPR